MTTPDIRERTYTLVKYINEHFIAERSADLLLEAHDKDLLNIAKSEPYRVVPITTRVLAEF